MLTRIKVSVNECRALITHNHLCHGDGTSKRLEEQRIEPATFGWFAVRVIKPLQHGLSSKYLSANKLYIRLEM